MSLEGEVAFSVISDLRGDERLLTAALTQLPEKILEFAKRKKISRGKSWPGLDRLVLIGNTPGHQLDDKSFMKFNPAWEGYLVPKFKEFASMGLFESGRIPKVVQEYGPAALASWFEKNGRHEMDKQAALDFRTYIGERDWKTGTWDTQHEGVATQNCRKFWKNVAKAIGKALFPLNFMPTDRIYAEEIAPEHDLPWDRQTIGGVTFRSMPIRKIQNKHFLHALALTPVHDLTKSPRRRDGTFYSFESFHPLDADVTLGYLFPTEFDKLLTEERAKDEELKRPSRERLLLFSYDLLLKDESHKKRAQAHLPTRVYEETQGTVATYVVHGKQAWRVQHAWDAKKGLLVDANEELINFVKPKPLHAIVTQEVTEESAACQLLSAPENFNMFIAGLRELNPAAADYLKDKNIADFEGLAHLQSGLYQKMNELNVSLLSVNADKETFLAKLLTVLGTEHLMVDIKEAVRKKFNVRDNPLPERAHVEMWEMASKEITDRYTHMVTAVERAANALKQKEKDSEQERQRTSSLEQAVQGLTTARDAAEATLLSAALHYGILFAKGGAIPEGVQALLAYAGEQRANVLKLSAQLEQKDETFQGEFAKKNAEIESLEKTLGLAQDALVVHLVGMLKPIYDCYHATDNAQTAAEFDRNLAAIVGKEVVDFFALLPAGESFGINNPDIAKNIYEKSAQVYAFARLAVRGIVSEYLKTAKVLDAERAAHSGALRKLATERDRNNELIGNYGKNIDAIKTQFGERVEKRAAEIAGTRVRDLEARTAGLERELEAAKKQAEELPALERDKLNNEHQRSTTAIQREHLDALNAQRREYEDKLGALRADYEGKLGVMRVEYEGKLAAAEKVHRNGQLAATKKLYAAAVEQVAKAAYALVAKRQYVEGVQLYSLALQHADVADKTKLVALYRNRGVARINAQDVSGAIEDFNAALALKPGDTTLVLYRAEAEKVIVVTKK